MTCQTCTEEGRKGYCARLRCYCGHEDCHAFQSWHEPVAPDITAKTSNELHATTWADREGPTWIDQM